MNIAFDAGAIEIGKGSGIGNYTLNQFERMIRQTPENEYFYFNTVEQSSLMDGIKADNFHYCFYDMGAGNRLREYNGTYRELYGELVKNFLKENQIDVFYMTAPFASGNVLYAEEWFAGVTVVATAWDIIPYVMKKTYLNDKNTYKWYMSCIDMLRWTDRQLAISNSVKDDMVQYLHFDPAKIDVIYGGVSERFRELAISDEEKTALYKKFGITAAFILCCVSADARKNVQGAVRAFARLPRNLIDQYQLVIVGRMLPEKRKEFEDLIRASHVEGRVVLTDYVTNEEMLMLYNLPEFMVFPSLYEGFGLPALESWACGTPVIASNNSSLGEIVGDAGLLFDPNDVSDMAKTMEAALTTADMAAFLEKGKAKVKQFTWDWVAELTLAAINTAVGQKEYAVEPRKEKIALVYPADNLGEIWSTLPTLLSYRFSVDVYADHPLADGMGCFPVKELPVRHKKYHTLLMLSPDATLPSDLVSAFSENRNLHLVAEEHFENLLFAAAGKQLPDENAVCGSVKYKLSGYFGSPEKRTAFSFDRVATASDAVRQTLLEQSLACPVYGISPLEQAEHLPQAKVSDLADVLIENLSTAILDEKPWGRGMQWQDGEVLFEEVSQALVPNSLCSVSNLQAISHTLGAIYSGTTARHLDAASFSMEKSTEKKLRVDFVTSWNTKCGIAEFTRFYYDVIKNRVAVKVYPNEAETFVRKDEGFVANRVWKFHDAPTRLAFDLLKSDAEIVHIQYTEGFFRVQDLVEIFTHCKGKKFLLTCHNTLYLKGETPQETDVLNTAHYVVHQEKDFQQLLDNGIVSEHIHLIPLGQVAFPQEDKNKIRARMGFAENCGPVIGSYGFLFDHKGILETIRAIALLKDKYPHILYMPCCSIYTSSEASVDYYKTCQSEIKKLGLEQHVKMISDFLEAKESAYLLQACDATVLAYGHTNESASGAIRFCVAANRPMMTTKEQIFNEFADCALQIENNAPKTIAAGLDNLLSKGESASRKEAMERVIAKTGWDTVGRAYMQLYQTFNSGK